MSCTTRYALDWNFPTADRVAFPNWVRYDGSKTDLRRKLGGTRVALRRRLPETKPYLEFISSNLQDVLLRPMGLDILFFSLNSLLFLPEYFAVDTYTSRLRLSKISKKYDLSLHRAAPSSREKSEAEEGIKRYIEYPSTFPGFLGPFSGPSTSICVYSKNSGGKNEELSEKNRKSRPIGRNSIPGTGYGPRSQTRIVESPNHDHQ
ncbi:hypothetical protein B0H13DRAFT_1858228 [Mycena leptocephala]|nr:hypothetical protein B0H13DRAFT_1858228 [Mycena leptocephala]